MNTHAAEAQKFAQAVRQAARIVEERYKADRIAPNRNAISLIDAADFIDAQQREICRLANVETDRDGLAVALDTATERDAQWADKWKAAVSESSERFEKLGVCNRSIARLHTLICDVFRIDADDPGDISLNIVSVQNHATIMSILRSEYSPASKVGRG